MVTETLRTTQLSSDPFGLNGFDFSVRTPEESEIFNEEDALAYIEGCDYPESADDLLLALEIQRLFGPVEIRRMRILDTMCGPGRLGREFLQLGAQHVVFHDGDETMITHAKTQAFQVMQSGQSIGFVISDVGHIPLPDNMFDLVICHNATHQLSDSDRLGAIMREFVRITASSGSVVIADFQRPETSELLQAASARLQVTKPEIVPLLIPTYTAAFSKDEFREAIQSISGVRNWSVTDAEPPLLTWQIWQKVEKDPIKGHLMDYSPISLRAIVQKK